MGTKKDGFSVVVMDLEGVWLAEGKGSTEADAREGTGVLNRRKK